MNDVIKRFYLERLLNFNKIDDKCYKMIITFIWRLEKVQYNRYDRLTVGYSPSYKIKKINTFPLFLFSKVSPLQLLTIFSIHFFILGKIIYRITKFAFQHGCYYFEATTCNNSRIINTLVIQNFIEYIQIFIEWW